MAVVVEVVGGSVSEVQESSSARIIDVIGKSPIASTNVTPPVVEVVKPGGTVANVGFGTTLPENPQQGQIWILIQ